MEASGRIPLCISSRWRFMLFTFSSLLQTWKQSWIRLLTNLILQQLDEAVAHSQLNVKFDVDQMIRDITYWSVVCYLSQTLHSSYFSPGVLGERATDTLLPVLEAPAKFDVFSSDRWWRSSCPWSPARDDGLLLLELVDDGGVLLPACFPLSTSLLPSSLPNSGLLEQLALEWGRLPPSLLSSDVGEDELESKCWWEVSGKVSVVFS